MTYSDPFRLTVGTLKYVTTHPTSRLASPLRAFRRPNRRRLRAVIAASTMSIALVSCSDSNEPELQEAQISPAQVQIVNAGEKEKASIAWNDDGAAQESTVVLTQGFVQKSDTDTGNSTNPDTRLELPLTTNVTGDGNGRVITTTVGKPHGSNADLNEDIATAEGFKAEWTATATGLHKSLKLGAPKDSTDTARAGVEAGLTQLLQLPIVFPEQPVGINATWTATTKSADETAMTQKVTYTLTGRSGNTVDIKVNVTEAPSTNQLDTGTEAPLKVIDSSTKMLSGKITVDLTKPLPVAGIVDYVTSVTYGDGTSTLRIVQQSHRAVEYRQ